METIHVFLFSIWPTNPGMMKDVCHIITDSAEKDCILPCAAAASLHQFTQTLRWTTNAHASHGPRVWHRAAAAATATQTVDAAQNHAISPDFIQPQNLVFEMRGILAEYSKKEEIFHTKHYIIHLRELALTILIYEIVSSILRE